IRDVAGRERAGGRRNALSAGQREGAIGASIGSGEAGRGVCLYGAGRGGQDLLHARIGVVGGQPRGLAESETVPVVRLYLTRGAQRKIRLRNRSHGPEI